MKDLIMGNRKNTDVLKANDFQDQSQYKAWKDAVEGLRIWVSYIAIMVHENKNKTVIEDVKQMTHDDAYMAYRKVLSFFDKSHIKNVFGFWDNDLKSLLTFIGTYRKDANYLDEGQQFLPNSKDRFRKCFENFMADRFMNVSHESAEEIESRKQLKREAKKLRNINKKAETNRLKQIEMNSAA